MITAECDSWWVRQEHHTQLNWLIRHVPTAQCTDYTQHHEKKKKRRSERWIKEMEGSCGEWKKKTERKGKETAGVCVVYWKDRWRCSEKNKHATVERLFHLEMKGVDGEQAISKGNIITFSYLLLEPCGGGRGRRGEEEGRGWWRRGAFKSNNPSLRYIHFFSHSPPHLVTFRPNLSISLYVPPFSTCGFFPLLSDALFFFSHPPPHAHTLPVCCHLMWGKWPTAALLRKWDEGEWKQGRKRRRKERKGKCLSLEDGKMESKQKGKCQVQTPRGEKKEREPAEGSLLNTTSLPSFFFFFEKKDGRLRGVVCICLCYTSLALSFYSCSGWGGKYARGFKKIRQRQ